MQRARSIAIHACAAVLLLVAYCALNVSISAQAQLNAPIPDPAAQWNEPGFDRGKLFDVVVETVAQNFLMRRS
jgi:hypothetical protein